RIAIETGGELLLRLVESLQILPGQAHPQTRQERIRRDLASLSEDLDRRRRRVVTKEDLPQLKIRRHVSRLGLYRGLATHLLPPGLEAGVAAGHSSAAEWGDHVFLTAFER